MYDDCTTCPSSVVGFTYLLSIELSNAFKILLGNCSGSISVCSPIEEALEAIKKLPLKSTL